MTRHLYNPSIPISGVSFRWQAKFTAEETCKGACFRAEFRPFPGILKPRFEGKVRNIREYKGWRCRRVARLSEKCQCFWMCCEPLNQFFLQHFWDFAAQTGPHADHHWPPTVLDLSANLSDLPEGQCRAGGVQLSYAVQRPNSFRGHGSTGIQWLKAAICRNTTNQEWRPFQCIAHCTWSILGEESLVWDLIPNRNLASTPNLWYQSPTAYERCTPLSRFWDISGNVPWSMSINNYPEPPVES